MTSFQFHGSKIEDKESWNIHSLVENVLRSSVQSEYLKYSQRKGMDANNQPSNAQIIGLLPNTMEKDSNVWIFQKLVRLPTTVRFLVHFLSNVNF